MTKLRFAPLVLLIAVSRTPPTEACSCASSNLSPTAQEIAKSRRQAALIFRGKVVALRDTEENSGIPMDTVATFAVLDGWKGPHQATLEVHSRVSRMCDYRFEQGEEYVVFASGEEPVASTCGLTAHVVHPAFRKTVHGLGKPRWTPRVP